ncbi:Methyltransferase-like protein 7B [Escovopsis weberi]|uniref:Methyltransferase-like protein 7B n=1 Tax=Escovopsis weberi TaxID=150374 RepID=A0A0M9VXI3_ESCWE|nr:Methyltransferase-like protein 7B [Escovopsis weberi]
MSVWDTCVDACVILVEPWLLVLYSLSHVPQTVRQIVRSGDWARLLSPSAFHDALFGNFWATFGPNVKQNAQVNVIPLLQGRVRGGRVHEDPVGPPIRGTVIEVGAGSGLWADVFARFAGPQATERLPGSRGITKIYGIEPNAISAVALRARVKEVGLGNVYEVVPVGIEDVEDEAAWGGRIEPGSVDAIVSILCLCSIPEPEKNIKLLYRLLKPGGTWYLYEHVKTKRGGPLMSLYQRLIAPVWRISFGSCQLCRNTEKSLRDAGPWEHIDLCQPPTEPTLSLCPHIYGSATKKL